MKCQKLTLKNGLRILLVPQESLAASVLVLVEAGSEYETKKINGLSHFLEHMMFKGTVNRPRVGMTAEELAGLGAQSNAFTAEEYTGYWAKVESKKISHIVDIVCDLYLNPIFNPEEIEKERGVVIEELNMREDNPMVKIHDIFPELLYGDQPAGFNVGGRKEVIKALTRDDFLAYRGAHYVASRTIVVVAGKFDRAKTLKQIEDHFGHVQRGKRIVKQKTKERQTKPNILLNYKESDQSHLVLGARAFTIFDKRRTALQVLADVLGGGMSSRLFKKVRGEMGAAYYVGASSDFYLDHGCLGISAGVDHGKIEQVLRAIMEELRRLTRERVPEKELQRSKDHLVGNLILDLETADELAGFYGGQEILTRRIVEPKELVTKIQRVGAEEIRTIAKAIFRNKGLNLAVIGPHKNRVTFEEILSL
jgi:predicted Zn-dependent peptidase